MNTLPRLLNKYLKSHLFLYCFKYLIFTARQQTLSHRARYWYTNSVCLSVCLSVRMSVCRECTHCQGFGPSGRCIIAIFLATPSSKKIPRCIPSEGTFNTRMVENFEIFNRKSTFISEMVRLRDKPIVTMDHQHQDTGSRPIRVGSDSDDLKSWKWDPEESILGGSRPRPVIDLKFCDTNADALSDGCR